jgi:hypothetical protein
MAAEHFQLHHWRYEQKAANQAIYKHPSPVNWRVKCAEPWMFCVEKTVWHRRIFGVQINFHIATGFVQKLLLS